MAGKTLSDMTPNRRYAQPSAVMRDYGIGRSTIYKWISEELVRSAVIRTGKGKSKKAIRLIDLQSLEEFLAKNASGPQV